MTAVPIDKALEAVLTRELGAAVRLSGPVTPLSGGFFASIYRFEVVAAPSGFRGPLVLRVMPERQGAVREALAQRTVASQGYPTPRVLLDGFDETIGGAFMVMPLAAGKPPLGALSGARVLIDLPGVLRRLPRQLASAAAQLHALDPAPFAAAAESIGDDPHTRGMRVQLELLALAATTGGHGFDELVRSFAPGPPGAPAGVICHGDLHPMNLLVDEHGEFTVLDWTNANLMPPEFDVGFASAILRCAPVSVPRFLGPALRKGTTWLAERFVAEYERRRPLDRGLLAWFEALQYARCLSETAVSRVGIEDVVGPTHPFEVAREAMLRRLRELTGIDVRLPERRAPRNG